MKVNTVFVFDEKRQYGEPEGVDAKFCAECRNGECELELLTFFPHEKQLERAGRFRVDRLIV